MKRTARKRIGLSLAAGIAALSLSLSGGFAPSGAFAQDLSHPAHIHNGDCSAPGDVIAPLDNLMGSADLTANDTTVADMTIADLLATPHAIVTHESDANIGNYLACGNVAGVVENGTLTVGLAELNGSGVQAAAFLQDTDGGVEVSILEIEHAGVEGMAMSMETDAHPSHVHTGDCTAPGEVVFPLGDIAPVAGTAEGGTPSLMVEQGYTEIDTTLADLTSAPHSIVAHLSADEIGTYLVCGDITTMAGAEADETMVPLMELGGSGYVGAAYLMDTADGKVDVWAFLFPGIAGGMASPVADTGEMEHDMGTPATTGDTAGEAVTATIEGFAFNPGDIEVAAGTTVTWTNNDSSAHTVTADDGSFQSGRLEQGQSFSFTFDTAGTFAYHCEYHSGMTATVTVS